MRIIHRPQRPWHCFISIVHRKLNKDKSVPQIAASDKWNAPNAKHFLVQYRGKYNNNCVN